MTRTLRRVAIVGTGSFLPNAPVAIEEIDDLLGPLDDASLEVRKFIRSVGQRMLRTSGVVHRHFAIDRNTGNLTHTIAALAEEAARPALDAAGLPPQDIDLLLLSSPGYDACTPPTTTLLQERLGIRQCAEMEIHSNCAGVGKCVEVAYHALRLGRYRTALVVYPQLSSAFLRRCYFNAERITKNQAALRYILSDGGGALVLQAVDAGPEDRVPHELLGSYIESVGGDRPAGMTAGAGAADLVDRNCQFDGMVARGTHHLDQDFAAVKRDGGALLIDGIGRMLKTIGIDPSAVSHCVVSAPSLQLYEDSLQSFLDRYGGTQERVRFRAAETGYCGGATILVHFDRMVRSGELTPGQIVILHAVEASKWLTGGLAVRW